jgi:hypothetical protein
MKGGGRASARDAREVCCSAARKRTLGDQETEARDNSVNWVLANGLRDLLESLEHFWANATKLARTYS